MHFVHKQTSYTHVSTKMSSSADDDKTSPLLAEDEFHDAAEDVMDANIPPLNPEDPLFGLRSAQVAASREVFGANEIVIPETPLWKLFGHQFVGFLVSARIRTSIRSSPLHHYLLTSLTLYAAPPH